MATLKNSLDYDPETGTFTWKWKLQGWRRGKNKLAGSKGKSGYVTITWEGRKLRAGRVAWYLYYGKWPKRDVDHINGVKDDNRITNLREISHAENILAGYYRKKGVSHGN